MAEDKFFQEEEQKAQEELDRIKIGEVEYESKELEELVGKGKRLDEFAKKYNTDPDKAWSAYGKTTQENKELKLELDRLREQVKFQSGAQAELTQDQIQAAKDQLKNLGVVTREGLDQWYQERRSGERLLDECKSYEEEISGDDGRPKFVTNDILTHMAETGMKNPLKAYKDKFEKELDAWKESELNKEKGSVLPTLTTTTAKQPKTVPVTKDNLGQLIREQLYGSQNNE
jgi:regulator of replication initiation timing